MKDINSVIEKMKQSVKANLPILCVELGLRKNGVTDLPVFHKIVDDFNDHIGLGLTSQNMVIDEINDQARNLVATDHLVSNVNDSRRMKNIRRLIGYVENGSDTVVTIRQDDATKGFIVKVGKKSYYDKSLGEAIDRASSDYLNED